MDASLCRHAVTGVRMCTSQCVNKGLFKYGNYENWKQTLSVVLPSFSFCFILFIWFCCWLFCRAFNFPLFLYASIFACPSFCCLQGQSSFCHSSNDSLCVWIPLSHPPYCLPYDLYHAARILRFQFGQFYPEDPAALEWIILTRFLVFLQSQIVDQV